MALSKLVASAGNIATISYTQDSVTAHATAKYLIDTEGVPMTGQLRKVKWSPSAIYTTSVTATAAVGKVIHQPTLISGLTRGTDASGTLHAVRLLDKGYQGLDVDIILMNATVTFPANGSAFSLSDADADAVFNKVKFYSADYEDQTLNYLAIKENLGKTLWPVSGSDDCYVALVYRGTAAKTFGASDLEITFEVY